MAISKETLWSMSTTIREAERIEGFLRTAAKLDGEEWTSETQRKFQILLIQNHEYLKNTDNAQVRSKLDEEQVRALSSWDKEMPYEMAESVFNAKQYEDPAMRGRQSMSPLIKLGLAYYEKRNGTTKVFISDMGHKLLDGKITFDEMMLEALLKYQYPNPADSGFKTWNTKPFINTIRLIKRVNELCASFGIKPKGISTIEFGIFVLSLRNYEDVDDVARKILEFRQKLESITSDNEREAFSNEFTLNYLSNFNNPLKNCKEYTDNMVRYLRLTKYIYIRGKYNHTYVDLEPRRMTEITAILEKDNGSAQYFTLEEWNSYMGVYGTYKLPFETIEALTKIAKEIVDEIGQLEDELAVNRTDTSIPITIGELKRFIGNRRAYRTRLQNLKIKQEVHKDYTKINDTIESLKDILAHNKTNLAKKLSIELEKWTNVALNILNDATLIKPNSPVGDDNEPIYTAPNGVPDIECYYQSFNAICEVTMLTSRDQWYNEGQPVMRHLRGFEKNNAVLPNYCLFVAPSLHRDTVNTFYTSVKYEYEGKPQRIIPITIKQLIAILTTVQTVLLKHKKFTHHNIKELYDSCVDMSQIVNSTQWLSEIDGHIYQWSNKMLA